MAARIAISKPKITASFEISATAGVKIIKFVYLLVGLQKMIINQIKFMLL